MDLVNHIEVLSLGVSEMIFLAFSINSINIVSEASDQQLQIMDIQFKAFKGTVVNHANLLIGDN